MQQSNERGSSDSVTSQPSPKKAERPPLQKRSKTISGETHFPGPLFPAVRRSSTSLPAQIRPSDLRVSVDSDASLTQSNITPTSSSNGGNGSNFSFSERDWMYPSFLGPHMGRSRVTVKANKTQKNEFRGGVQGKVAVDEKQRIQVREEGEEEKEKKVVASQELVVTRTSSVSQPGGRTQAFKSSLLFYLVSSF